MNTEQPGFDFDKVRTAASTMWNKDLSKVQVEGGTKDEKTIFYIPVYHLLIHPISAQDVNGKYPMMESLKVEAIPPETVIRSSPCGIRTAT